MGEKTIAAVSTPLGEGGIGVIRISGDNAIQIADKCFKSFSGEKLCNLKGYRAAYGEIIDGDTPLDDGVALVFRAPKSYTGEDVVEISVHSGSVVLKKILRLVLKCGAVHAEGGEFTKRAFLNGKMDLAKAESVMDLIRARSEGAYNISRGAKEGRISRETEEITSKLLETAASIAAFADYPDEDIPGLSIENFKLLLGNCENRLSHLIKTYDMGKTLREGIDCAIVGKPNVGKSTLMNLLCGSEKSIVTDVAGTTRDIVENTVTLGDITLNLADTAGIHSTEDTVEKIGVARAKERIENAQIVLAVFDTSAPLDKNDLKLLEEIKDSKVIVVLNKSDLETRADTAAFKGFECIEISAKSGEGLSLLTEKVAQITQINKISPDDTVLITERQRDCAVRALDRVKEAIIALENGITTDAVGVCVDEAIAALLELTGKRVTNEVADEVFRRFCVGK